ncbi:MAG TPA: rRNA maturation RNase YbeY [bacterium]|jgi:probable rRNA maturation factor
MKPPDLKPAVYLKLSAEFPRGFIGVENLEAFLSEAVDAILKESAIDAAPGVDVTICGDDKIRLINREHRGIDKPTDVLSFPQQTAEDLNEIGTDSISILGDLVISVETISRQASERGLDFAARFIECLIHGVLHLLTYDHEVDEDREVMERLEDQLYPKITDIADKYMSTD